MTDTINQRSLSSCCEACGAEMEEDSSVSVQHEQVEYKLPCSCPDQGTKRRKKCGYCCCIYPATRGRVYSHIKSSLCTLHQRVPKWFDQTAAQAREAVNAINTTHKTQLLYTNLPGDKELWKKIDFLTDAVRDPSTKQDEPLGVLYNRSVAQADPLIDWQPSPDLHSLTPSLNFFSEEAGAAGSRTGSEEAEEEERLSFLHMPLGSAGSALAASVGSAHVTSFPCHDGPPAPGGGLQVDSTTAVQTGTSSLPIQVDSTTIQLDSNKSADLGPAQFLPNGEVPLDSLPSWNSANGAATGKTDIQEEEEHLQEQREQHEAIGAARLRDSTDADMTRKRGWSESDTLEEVYHEAPAPRPKGQRLRAAPPPDVRPPPATDLGNVRPAASTTAPMRIESQSDLQIATFGGQPPTSQDLDDGISNEPVLTDGIDLMVVDAEAMTSTSIDAGGGEPVTTTPPPPGEPEPVSSPAPAQVPRGGPLGIVIGQSQPPLDAQAGSEPASGAQQDAGASDGTAGLRGLIETLTQRFKSFKFRVRTGLCQCLAPQPDVPGPSTAASIGDGPGSSSRADNRNNLKSRPVNVLDDRDPGVTSTGAGGAKPWPNDSSAQTSKPTTERLGGCARPLKMVIEWTESFTAPRPAGRD